MGVEKEEGEAVSEIDWSLLASPYRPKRVDCPFKDECRDYPRLCDTCTNNRAMKRSYFRPRWWKSLRENYPDSTRWETETYTSTYVPYEIRCDGVSTGRYTVSCNATSTVWTTSWSDP